MGDFVEQIEFLYGYCVDLYDALEIFHPSEGFRTLFNTFWVVSELYLMDA